jgi:hypothetical protein
VAGAVTSTAATHRAIGDAARRKLVRVFIFGSLPTSLPDL